MTSISLSHTAKTFWMYFIQHTPATPLTKHSFICNWFVCHLLDLNARVLLNFWSCLVLANLDYYYVPFWTELSQLKLSPNQNAKIERKKKSHRTHILNSERKITQQTSTIPSLGYYFKGSLWNVLWHSLPLVFPTLHPLSKAVCRPPFFQEVFLTLVSQSESGRNI